jgi:hypothetical protein
MMCVVELERTAGTEVVHAQKRVPILDVRNVKLALAPRSHLTFEAPPKPDPGEVEMPVIWRVLRDKAHAQLPSHRSKRVMLRGSPVMVPTPSGTVAGLGIAGDF